MCSGREYEHKKFKLHHFGFRKVIFTVDELSRQKCAMRCGMSKSRGLKVRRYAARLIDNNEYLTELPGAKTSDKFGDTEIN